MAGGIDDYADKILHPRPQLAVRLCFVPTTFRESPPGDEGEPPGTAPVLTLTPDVQQGDEETSTANPALAAAESARLEVPSSHRKDEDSHSFGRDDQGETMDEDKLSEAR